MVETEQIFERSLNQETLQRATELSQLKESGIALTFTARAVGPFTDEIKISFPDGNEVLEYIEEA